MTDQRFDTMKTSSSSKSRIISVIVVIIIGIVFMFFLFSGGGGADIDITSLELDITIPTTHSIGEPFEGEYYMKYDGTPFTGIVLYGKSREGFEEEYFSSIYGVISDVDFDNPQKTRYLKVALKAFKLNENGYVSSVDYFYDEGVYTYSISVYDCSTIVEELNKACDDVETDELLDVQPLKSKSKSVIVSGGQSPSECQTNMDCTETCEGCTEGKQICELSSEICVDCFADTQCIEGHECENNKCVQMS